MKNIVLLLSISFLLSSASFAFSGEWTCKGQLRECTKRSEDVDSCVNRYESCLRLFKKDDPRCNRIPKKSAKKTIGGVTSFPVYTTLLPVTFPLNLGLTTDFVECIDVEPRR